ncbi:MAG: lytic transglycosylase domain-containing protein [Elusimicrobiota bacterium]
MKISILFKTLRYVVSVITLVLSTVIIQEAHAPVTDNPRQSMGRVCLKNGNHFDGNIDISSKGKVTVYIDGGGMVFSPLQVEEIRLMNGSRLDGAEMKSLINHYASLQSSKSRFSTLINKYAAIHGVEKELLKALIRQESGFNPTAISHKGARGLMQLMPRTARQYGVTNIFDPAENISAGTEHLAYLLKKYNGDKRLALAAYNAGSMAVKKYNGVPPFRETTLYVRNIYRNYRALKGWEL